MLVSYLNPDVTDFVTEFVFNLVHIVKPQYMREIKMMKSFS